MLYLEENLTGSDWFWWEDVARRETKPLTKPPSSHRPAGLTDHLEYPDVSQVLYSHLKLTLDTVKWSAIMISSRGVYQVSLKLLLPLGILLYFRNAQHLTLSRTLGRDQQVELEMKERRELVERTCSKYGRRLKVPLKLYNKKLRSAESVYF